MWEVIGKGKELVPFEQDCFPEVDFLGVARILLRAIYPKAIYYLLLPIPVSIVYL